MRLGKSKIFLLFCLSFSGGVFLGRFLSFHVMAIAAMIFIILISVFWKHKIPMLIGFLGLTLILGALRLTSNDLSKEPDFIGGLYDQEITAEGVVVLEPDVRSDKINLTVRLRGYSGNVLLNLGRYPEYHYGDVLKVSGKIEEPFESEEFSYKNYLSRFETYAIVRFPEIEKIGEGRGNAIKFALLAVKQRFQETLNQILPEPHNAFVLGLIIGLKRAIPEDLQNAFIITGVSHIVVISGYNIGIITRNLLKTRMFWGRRVAFWSAFLTVIAFVILTGAEASVIRAAIMGMLLVLAMNVGRIYQAANALIFTGTVMVLVQPKILSFDIGFQLSFLATLGLIYLSPIFEKWFQRLPDILWLRTNLTSTLSAQIFTLPLLIFYFDRISITAPIVNVLILWAIPFTMFFGFLTGVFGMIYLPIGKIFGWLVWVLLEYMIRLINFFSSLPLASRTTAISIPMMILFYVILGAGIWIYRHQKKFYYQLEYIHGSAKI